MKTSKIVSTLIAIVIGFAIATFFVNKDKTEPADIDTTKVETNIQQSNKIETQIEDPINSASNETTDYEVDLTPIEPLTSNTETTKPEKLTYMITLKTNKGDIELVLDAEKAPNTVENFIQYAKNGQYDGTIFHRVINGFMVQGGGFESGLKQKEVGAPILNEANNGLLNNKYTIAMARTNDPHSATAQFFINTKDNDFLNFKSESGSGWGYAVFGEVTKGQEVVDAIELVATGNLQGYGDVPLEDIVIESVIVAQ